MGMGSEGGNGLPVLSGNYICVKDGVPAYQENDIMMAVSYLVSACHLWHWKQCRNEANLNYICGRRKVVVDSGFSGAYHWRDGT